MRQVRIFIEFDDGVEDPLCVQRLECLPGGNGLVEEVQHVVPQMLEQMIDALEERRTGKTRRERMEEERAELRAADGLVGPQMAPFQMRLLGGRFIEPPLRPGVTLTPTEKGPPIPEPEPEIPAPVIEEGVCAACGSKECRGAWGFGCAEGR